MKPTPESGLPDMKIFLDSADIGEINALFDTGFIDGVTTNPSLIAKSGQDILDTIAKICDLVDGGPLP